MMKIQKRYVLFSAATLALLFSGSSLSAQTTQSEPERSINRQVDVSRDYMPEVSTAVKLPFQPRMTDTVALRPQLDYSIRPSVWSTGFGVAAINPVRLDVWEQTSSLPFYLKIGGGFPGQSQMDLRAVVNGRSGGYAGFFIDHRGYYNKLRNDMDVKSRALESQNRSGFFGSLPIGRRMMLTGQAAVDFDVVSIYGRWLDPQIATGGVFDPKNPMQSFVTPHAELTFGHDFRDLTLFNFRFGARGYHLIDRTDNKETGVGLFVEGGKNLGDHSLRVKLGFDGRYGSGPIENARNSSITVAPRYSIRSGILDFGMGFDMVYDMRERQDDKVLFLPQAHLRLRVSDGFVPFATFSSAVVDNGYRSLSGRNPYIIPHLDYYLDRSLTLSMDYAPVNSRRYDFRAGFAGNIGGAVDYSLHGGWSRTDDPLLFTYMNFLTAQQGEWYASTGYFALTEDKSLSGFTAGAKIDARIGSKVSIAAEGNFYDYSAKTLDRAYGTPRFDASVFARYSTGRFSLKAGAVVTGKRTFLDYGIVLDAANNLFYTVTGETEAGTAVDVRAEAEYSLRKGFGVFLSGSNLANRDLYPYNHYIGRGIGVSAGVKIVF